MEHNSCSLTILKQWNYCSTLNLLFYHNIIHVCCVRVLLNITNMCVIFCLYLKCSLYYTSLLILAKKKKKLHLHILIFLKWNRYIFTWSLTLLCIWSWIVNFLEFIESSPKGFIPYTNFVTLCKLLCLEELRNTLY